jgi:hypothetical protein
MFPQLAYYSPEIFIHIFIDRPKVKLHFSAVSILSALILRQYWPINHTMASRQSCLENTAILYICYDTY